MSRRGNESNMMYESRLEVEKRYLEKKIKILKIKALSREDLEFYYEGLKKKHEEQAEELYKVSIENLELKWKLSLSWWKFWELKDYPTIKQKDVR